MIDRLSTRMLPVVFLATLGFLPPSTVAGQDFTLQDILSASMPTGLVAARDADVIAWVTAHEGSWNVWVARGPDYQGHQLTDWSGDDGQAISGLRLIPDGESVQFSRGGSNPALLPGGSERTVVRLPVDGGEAVPAVRSGTFSPDGTRIAYTESGEIWVVDYPEGEPRSVVNPRTPAQDLTWSPDGTRIAFVSPRGDHSFIGVVDVETGAYRYLEPSVDQDRDPAWSPDGRRLAYLRIPSDEQPYLLFFARPDAEFPWSIRVTDLEADVSREVFRADPGSGSRFAGVGASAQLWWTTDGYLVFPWEKGGWNRLWAVTPEGGAPRLLIPGEHVIQTLELASDGRTFVFDSNRDDIDRKHIWTVTAEPGEPRLLTPGQGVEWGPVATSTGTVAFLGSGARTPARPWVLNEDGSRSAPQGPVVASFPDADELVTPEQIIFPATDGVGVHAQLFLPPELEEGERRPALIFLHGGPRRQMFLGFHGVHYYHNAYSANQYLASRGYVVLSVNYRSGVGYGLEFREAEDYGAEGASEVGDLLGAALYLRGRTDVDPDRIGLWGGSYGGYLTAQGLVRAPDLFAAGVDIHGVHDWNTGIQNFIPSYERSRYLELWEQAFRVSPLAEVDQWEDPVLFIHGDDDRNVNFSETVRLVRELRRLGVPHDVLAFPDEAHDILLHRNRVAMYQATVDWFDRWLR